MKFENAYHGVKKIFTAELLMLIGAACLLMTGVVAAITLASAVTQGDAGTAAAGISGLVFLAAAGILPIIGFFINLAGLRQAAKDEDSFRTAFWISILAIVLSIVSVVISLLTAGTGIVDDIAGILMTVCEIIIFVFVIRGIMNLAQKLENEEVRSMGERILVGELILYCMSLIAKLISTFFQSSATASAVSGYLSIGTGILAIITYIVYLVYLAKAKTMLNQSQNPAEPEQNHTEPEPTS